MWQSDSMKAHNLETCWLLTQIKTIKCQPRNNETVWHTCSWRIDSKDVLQPPLLLHVIMTSELLRQVITDSHGTEQRWDLCDRVDSTDTNATEELEGQVGAYQNSAGNWFTLCLSTFWFVTQATKPWILMVDKACSWRTVDFYIFMIGSKAYN